MSLLGSLVKSICFRSSSSSSGSTSTDPNVSPSGHTALIQNNSFAREWVIMQRRTQFGTCMLNSVSYIYRHNHYHEIKLLTPQDKILFIMHTTRHIYSWYSSSINGESHLNVIYKNQTQIACLTKVTCMLCI